MRYNGDSTRTFTVRLEGWDHSQTTEDQKINHVCIPDGFNTAFIRLNSGAIKNELILIEDSEDFSPITNELYKVIDDMWFNNPEHITAVTMVVKRTSPNSSVFELVSFNNGAACFKVPNYGLF